MDCELQIHNRILFETIKTISLPPAYNYCTEVIACTTSSAYNFEMYLSFALKNTNDPTHFRIDKTLTVQPILCLSLLYTTSLSFHTMSATQ